MTSNRFMYLSILVVFSLLLNAIEVSALECVDKQGRFEIKGQKKPRSCKWAARLDTHKRCKFQGVKASCPTVCNAECFVRPFECRDSNTTFIANFFNMKPKTCKWVIRKKTAVRCGKLPNVRKWCPLTCGACGDEPSATPTISMKPSSSPVQIPSTVPSVSPSDSPSARPSYLCEDSKGKFLISEKNVYKPCSWVAKLNTTYRCSLTPVPTKCPRTCGNCLDSPSASPSVSKQPSSIPSSAPSLAPTVTASNAPSLNPSESPSVLPSSIPSYLPSQHPSSIPSSAPSRLPSTLPSLSPSKIASSNPSSIPSHKPSSIPSQIPSVVPSSEPSACVDDTNYSITVPSSGPSPVTIDCSFFSSQNFCNQFNTVVGTNDKTNEQACCQCGGSIYQSVQPSLAPSDIPSIKPSVCVDVPAWTANTGSTGSLTCADFNEQACTIGYVDTNGISNQGACCVCGGGLHTQN